jgi:hypothetical protein
MKIMKTNMSLLKGVIVSSTLSLFSLSSSAQLFYNYTGSLQTYTVPFGIDEVFIQTYGAEGGKGFPLMSNGGLGGYAEGYLSVSEGDVLEIYVGGYGGDGNSNSGGAGGFNGGGLGAVYSGSFSGGGGGGASDVRISPYGLANRVIVAGGGGGGGYNYSTTNYDQGGAGGGVDGATGLGGNVVGGMGSGTGGSQSAGGIGGYYNSYCTADNGGLGYGGHGALSCSNGGGGGGSGYYGGGGACWSGAGGGSSYIGGVTSAMTVASAQNGNGFVIITEICAEDIYTASLVDAITITADQNGDAYQWVDCDNNYEEIIGAQDQTFEPVANGNYAVIVTNGNCSDTSNCVSVVSVSLTELSSDEITIYPNPSNDGFIHLQYSGTIQSMIVLDLFGREQSVKINTEGNTIDASKLSNGTYIIQLKTDGKVIQKEVMILK